MNAFDEARREIIAALLMEYHRSPHSFVDYEELASRYLLKTKKEWFGPIIKEIDHLLTVSETYDDISALVSAGGYGEILRECLRNLEADRLEIDWGKEEILSDAKDYHWFPLPNGWKWYQFSGEPKQAARATFDSGVFDPDMFDTNDPPQGSDLTNSIKSADWTGVESRLAADPRTVGEIRQKIAEINTLVERAGLTNVECQKAKAITEALVKLVESPEPEWKAIVELLTSKTLTAALNVATIIQIALRLIIGI